MKRVLLKIAYDGTGFRGFQALPGLRTVEGELCRAIGDLTGEEIKLIGASRTDSGVHALGNIVVFDTKSPVPAERFPFALIKYLPADLKAAYGAEVPPDWHPRRQEAVKLYEYAYSVGRMENPKERLYASFINRDPSRYPDAEKMREAASYLTGEHDFTSFANPGSQVLINGGSAVRKIYSIDISDSGGGLDISESPLTGNRRIIIRVSGNGFLYNMVRIMAGTLMNVGLGVTAPGDIPEILNAKDRTAAGPTAEARGLTLLSVNYLSSPEKAPI